MLYAVILREPIIMYQVGKKVNKFHFFFFFGHIKVSSMLRNKNNQMCLKHHEKYFKSST